MDWNPAAYSLYAAARLRPALDLIRALPHLPDGPVVDLGCGNGQVAEALAQLGRPLIGVDSSDSMLEDAAATGAYTRLVQADIATWEPARAPALIYSNAALHWLPDHAALLPRLARSLTRGGTLAVQMPHQNNAPSHRLWRSLADEHFPGRTRHATAPGVLLPAEYHHALAPLGRFELWETEYYQHLPPAADGHPVRKFTEATYARPILDALAPEEQARLITAYEGVIDKAYPDLPGGGVLFPFRRLFFTLTV